MVGAELVALIVHFLLPVSDSLNLTQQLGAIALIGMPGPTIATMQWIWLRRRMRKAGWWIAAAVAGWYVVLGLSALRGLPAVEQFAAKFETATDIIFYFLLGAVMSLPQWLLLRRQFLGASYWLVARPLGWLAGYGLIFLARVKVDFFEGIRVFGRDVPVLVGMSVVGELFGFGLGAVTGATMVWILRKPIGVAGGPAFIRSDDLGALR
jgi:hypothetical protein